MTSSFENIIAWQKAHEFVVFVYRVTEHYPKTESFGLVSQFRRAAVSIPANIAEGYKRLSKQEKLRFFNISQGSLEECRYYCILSHDLDFIDSDTYNIIINMLSETSYMLNAYINGVVNNSGIKD